MFLTKDGNGNPIPLVPSKIPLYSTNSSSISTATTITLKPLTDFIEVSAVNQGVFLKFSAGVTTSSGGFHAYIPADTVRHYDLPDGTTAISVIEAGATATVIVIEY